MNKEVTIINPVFSWPSANELYNFFKKTNDIDIKMICQKE